MSKDVTRDEFTTARAKCDDEIAELTRLIDSIEKQETIIKQQNDLIIDISNAINEIVEGMTYEDEFYRNLLDRMVVHDKDHIDVYLNLLPHKWSYTVAKAKMPHDDETLNRNISDNDIGTEELAHLEIIGAIVSQLTRNATPEEMRKAGLDANYVDHGLAVYPQSAAGIPWTAASIQSKGDPITDLYEDMAADEKPKWHNQDKNKPAKSLEIE